MTTYIKPDVIIFKPPCTLPLQQTFYKPHLVLIKLTILIICNSVDLCVNFYQSRAKNFEGTEIGMFSFTYFNLSSTFFGWRDFAS